MKDKAKNFTSEDTSDWKRVVFAPKAEEFTDEDGEIIKKNRRIGLKTSRRRLSMNTLRFRLWLAIVLMMFGIVLVAWLALLIVINPDRLVIIICSYVTGAVFVACLILSVVIANFVTKPLRNLSKEVDKYRDTGRAVEIGMSGFYDVDELRYAFIRAIEEVERNNRFRRDLLSNISHDMKTPLTIIKAYGEKISEISAAGNDKCIEDAKMIVHEATRLNNMIDEVTELSKIEAGVEPINYTEVDYTERVNNAIKRFEELEGCRHYKFIANVEPNLRVSADIDKIARVFYNLVSNAINYTGEDKIVYIDCFKRNGFIETHIRDTGKGIASDDLLAVWDKYYRLVQDKRAVIGSGLGLSIVKTVMEKHNAPYGVSSKVGVGSDFFYILGEKPLVIIDEKKPKK